jgi:hypothetical protein
VLQLNLQPGLFQALTQKMPDFIFARLLPVLFLSRLDQIIDFSVGTAKSLLFFNRSASSSILKHPPA